MSQYDDSADTLYVHFGYLAKNVDSKIIDKEGEIVLGFNGKGKGVLWYSCPLVHSLTNNNKNGQANKSEGNPI